MIPIPPPDDVVYGPVPAGLAGYYDHTTGLIHIDPTLSAATQRVTLAHERIHKTLGHRPLAGAEHLARELRVEILTARRLIPFSLVLAGFMLSVTLPELARLWDVDVGLVITRLSAITPLEHTIIEVCGRHCTRRFVAPNERTDSRG